MFDRIAPVYDVMNRLMTAGLDGRWRRLAASLAVRPGDRVLDAACGTGDLAVADVRAGAGRVTGLDFSERMLARARVKAPAVEWVQGDMLALPFADATFDAATVGFGVRNVADLPQAPDSITVAESEDAWVSAGQTVWVQRAGSWTFPGSGPTQGTDPVYLE